MAKTRFPPVSQELIKALESHFSGTLPNNLDTTLDAFRVQQGEQRVVSFLRHQYEKQSENILEN